MSEYSNDDITYFYTGTLKFDTGITTDKRELIYISYRNAYRVLCSRDDTHMGALFH